MSERPAARTVLLVEDDASIARFVAMALEDDPVVLTTARTLREARGLLQQRRFDVVVCDLMLPDGSGRELLGELRTASATRRVAFSASLQGLQQAELARLGVHEALSKPVAMDALRRAVGVADAAPAEAAGAGSEPATHPDADATEGAAEDAVREFFGGDRGLYDVYRRQCVEQFGADVMAGDRSVAAGRWAELQHLAHSLKSVLRMLGDPAGSAVARALEDHAAAADAAAAAAGWRALRAHLQRGPAA